MSPHRFKHIAQPHFPPCNPSCAKSFHLFNARQKDSCHRTKVLKL